MTGRWPAGARVGLLDAVVAASLTAVSQAELVSNGVWSPVAALFSLVMTGTLALRRTFPWAVLLVPLAWGGQALVLEPAPSTLGNGLALMVAVYAAGEALGPVRSLPVLALTGVASVVFETDQKNVDAAAGDMVMAVAAWIIGLVIAERRRRTTRRLTAADEDLRAAELRTATALAEERQRMARELHDVVSHGVTVVVMQARGARAMLDIDREQSRIALDAIERAGQDALADMRRLVTLLRDPAPGIQPQPGLDDLDRLVTAARLDVPVDVTVTGEPVELPSGLGLTAYRLVQEGLTNALRHAPGAAIDLRVDWAPDHLTITIENAAGGEAESTAAPGSGFGLLGLRERVELYGGTLDYGLTDDVWGVRARLPVATVAPTPETTELR